MRVVQVRSNKTFIRPKKIKRLYMCIPLISLIWTTIVWYSLPTLDLQPGYAHTSMVNAHTQNMVPILSKLDVVPILSKHNVVPSQSKHNMVSILSIQTVVPNHSTQNMIPDQSRKIVIPNQKKIKEKYLVYLCDEKRDCGGWGDRQRGMVSLFLLSLVWKRKFKILMFSPCDIKPYYKPTKEYNWIFTENELKELKAKTKRTLAFISNDIPLMKLNMNNSNIAEVLYVKTNCYSYSNISEDYANFLPTYLKNKSRAAIFRETWNRFMIPTDTLINQVMDIRSTGKINLDAKTSENELICAHLRIGRSEYLPHDYHGMPLTAVPKVWDFIDNNFHNKSRIFVASDHPDVRQSALSKYGTRYIGSYAYAMNPDKMRANLTLACSSLESAYVDQLMLSKCDVLIYYRRSGFSLHASYLKTKWREMYAIMGHTNTSVFLRKTNYQYYTSL